MHLNINFFLLLFIHSFIHSFISFFKIILTLFNIIICNLICNLVLTCIHLLTTLPWVRECCEIDNIFEKGFLFLLLCLSGWEGCLSSGYGGSARICLSQKMENQSMRARDKRLGDQTQRLVVNSSLMEVRGLHKLPGHGMLWVNRSCQCFQGCQCFFGATLRQQRQ